MNLASNCRYLLWFLLLCRKSIWLSWSSSSLEWKSTAGITAMSYSLSRCCQRSSMLQAIYVCLSTRQRSISSHLIMQGHAPLSSYSKKRWTSLVQISGHKTNPDLNIVDYKVWGVMQQRVYECHEQCQWAEAAPHWRLDSLQHNVIDAAINEWKKQLRACVHADGQHFEHLLRARVTDKSYGQIKYKQLKKMLIYCWTGDFPGLKPGDVVYQTTFWWHIYSAIFVPKITGIGQLLLKLSLVVGWYPFLRHSVWMRSRIDTQ